MPHRPQDRIAQDRIVTATPVPHVVAETFASTVRIVGRKPDDLVICRAIDHKLECIRFSKLRDEMARVVFALVIGPENHNQLSTGFLIDLVLPTDLFDLTGPTWTALDSAVSVRLNPNEGAAYFCSCALVPCDKWTCFIGSIESSRHSH